MTPTTPCSEPARWKQLLDGILPESEQAELQQHLETCVRCQQTLEGLVADKDSWLGLPRRLGQEDPVPEAALEGFLNQIRTADCGDVLPGTGPEVSGPNPPLVGELSTSLPLGDFRLLREVGRGGMGVVYEAEQLSLGRRVALKILPFAAAFDPRQLQRFKNEAQAAAQLRHPHIVAVHAVGCDRGVHYYAMDFVAGQTLACVIREQRRLTGRDAGEKPARRVAGAVGSSTQPQAAASTEVPADTAFFRTAARWGAEAAEALEHAHQLGVIHRDVKPANLLVDGHANLWVTDFGLAQVRENTRLTQTGDFLGTLRYMSPEQTQARLVVIDHRTDVYSLGATLYEVLTLEPAFAGRDPQEVLRRIGSEEPPAPRRLNRAIPAELETIALKAMAKSRDERYATARDLADDLRRFLEDKPIRARPPTALQRGRRWARRHRTLVGTAAACGLLGLVLAVVGLAASNALIRNERDKADAAQQEAIDSLNTVRKALNQMVVRLGVERLNFVPQMEEVRSDVLRYAVDLYQELRQRYPDDRALQQEAALATAWLGSALIKLGRKAEAEHECRRAIASMEQLDAQAPLDPPTREQLIRTYTHLGWLLTTVPGRRAEGIGAHEQALLYAEKLAADVPDSQRYSDLLAATYLNLGIVRRPTRPRDTEALLTQAVTLLTGPQSNAHELGRAYLALGELYSEEERLPEAEKAFRQAKAIQEKLVSASRQVWQLRERLGDTNVHLGRVLAATGRGEEAEQTIREAVAIWVELCSEYPGRPSYHDSLVIGQAALLMVLEPGGRSLEAQDLAGKLQATQPDNVHAHARMAWTLANCPEEKLRDPRRAVQLASKAVEMDPERAVHWRALAMARWRTGEPREAIGALDKARTLIGRDEGFDLFLRALATWQLGDKEQARRCRDDAVKWMKEHRPDDPELRRLRGEAEELIGPDAK